MDHDELKRILRRGEVGDLVRSGLCPDETGIASYVAGTMPEPERDRIEEHLAACAWCLGQVGFLVREQDQPPPSVPSALLSRVRRGDRSSARRLASFVASPRFLAPTAAALAVVVAIQLLPQVPETSSTSETTLRSTPSGAPIADSPVLVTPREGEMMTLSALEFHWREVSDALDYEVQVTTTAGDLVWQTRTETTYARPPAALSIETDRRYFVWVRARLEDGGLASSPPIEFELSGQ